MRVHARRHDTSTLSSRLVFAWTTFPVACEHALSCVKYHGTCMAHPKRDISHARNMESCVPTSKMPWNMRGMRIMSATYSTQVERGVIATCVLFSNSIIAIIYRRCEIILHEPHLDSLLMPCFCHCLQKYSVYHSLYTMCVFIFSIGPSGKGGSQVTVNINHPSHSIIDNVM